MKWHDLYAGVVTTLIIGGTGTVGSQVVKELLQRGAGVRVMTRSAEKAASLPAGVEGVVGDMADLETLPAAMAGADALFLVTPLVPDEINQGLAAVEAAKQAGIKYIVYLSIHKLETGPHIPHFATKFPVEYAVKNSGIDWTIIRPNNFFQNDYWFKDVIAQYGVYPQPLSELGLNRVDVRDIAEAVAISLTAPGHAGQTYSLVGADALTGERTAEIYSDVLGRPVQYVGADLEGWAAAAAGTMPAWQVLDLKMMYDHFLRHGLRATQAEVSTLVGLLGRAPRSFEEFAREMFAA
ncbi:SDR family oxidoreductase [Paludibaculum fermentans]|uniref:NmrA family NAD(P)-binding protein n=1 Tax=Paludibaculum fermentans TaxID=1473598 RepID=A0A7S7NVM8_PALFE|nr:NmrA family NAD(P)-binding protein [Paludibaculum fermentans]QOY90631.1 NmrA family NAD(P)-binding protein [Paludibaculum fermentans]